MHTCQDPNTFPGGQPQIEFYASGSSHNSSNNNYSHSIATANTNLNTSTGQHSNNLPSYSSYAPSAPPSAQTLGHASTSVPGLYATHHQHLSTSPVRGSSITSRSHTDGIATTTNKVTFLTNIGTTGSTLGSGSVNMTSAPITLSRGSAFAHTVHNVDPGTNTNNNSNVLSNSTVKMVPDGIQQSLQFQFGSKSYLCETSYFHGSYDLYSAFLNSRSLNSANPAAVTTRTSLPVPWERKMSSEIYESHCPTLEDPHLGLQSNHCCVFTAQATGIPLHSSICVHLDTCGLQCTLNLDQSTVRGILCRKSDYLVDDLTRFIKRYDKTTQRGAKLNILDSRTLLLIILFREPPTVPLQSMVIEGSVASGYKAGKSSDILPEPLPKFAPSEPAFEPLVAVEPSAPQQLREKVNSSVDNDGYHGLTRGSTGPNQSKPNIMPGIRTTAQEMSTNLPSGRMEGVTTAVVRPSIVQQPQIPTSAQYSSPYTTQDVVDQSRIQSRGEGAGPLYSQYANTPIGDTSVPSLHVPAGPPSLSIPSAASLAKPPNLTFPNPAQRLSINESQGFNNAAGLSAAAPPPPKNPNITGPVTQISKALIEMAKFIDKRGGSLSSKDCAWLFREVDPYHADVLDKYLKSQKMGMSSLILVYPEAGIWRDTASIPFHLVTKDPFTFTNNGAKVTQSQIKQREWQTAERKHAEALRQYYDMYPNMRTVDKERDWRYDRDRDTDYGNNNSLSASTGYRRGRSASPDNANGDRDTRLRARRADSNSNSRNSPPLSSWSGSGTGLGGPYYSDQSRSYDEVMDRNRPFRDTHIDNYGAPIAPSLSATNSSNTQTSNNYTASSRCPFYEGGLCLWGRKCRFSHPPEAPPAMKPSRRKLLNAIKQLCIFVREQGKLDAGSETANITSYVLPFEDGYRRFVKAQPEYHQCLQDTLYFETGRYDNIGKLVTSHDLRDPTFELTLTRPRPIDKDIVAGSHLKSILVLRLEKNASLVTGANASDEDVAEAELITHALGRSNSKRADTEDEEGEESEVSWQVDSAPLSQQSQSQSQQILTQESVVLADTSRFRNRTKNASEKKTQIGSEMNGYSTNPSSENEGELLQDSLSSSKNIAYSALNKAERGDSVHNDSQAHGGVESEHEIDYSNDPAYALTLDFDSGPDKHELINILRPLLSPDREDDEEEEEEA